MTDQLDNEYSGFTDGAGSHREPIFKSNAFAESDSEMNRCKSELQVVNAPFLRAGRLTSDNTPDGRSRLDLLSITRTGLGESKPVKDSKFRSREAESPLETADDPLRAYFSALGNYKFPGVDKENALVRSLAGTEQKLLSVLAEFPGTSHWLLNPAIKSSPAEADIANSNDHSDGSEDPLLTLAELRCAKTDSCPSPGLNAGAAAAVEPECQAVQIDPQMDLLSTLHNDLIASCVRYGADHPICTEQRRNLASAFRKLQLSSGCVFRLVDRLLTFARKIGKVERRFGQAMSVQRHAVFEKQYGIGFPDFDRIVNQSLPLYRQWQQDRNALVELHLGFVVYLAKKYSRHSIDFLDLIQEGNLGLIKAVEHFNYRLGFKFSTYAGYWIRLEISRFVARNSHLVRLPYRLKGLLNATKRNAELFRQSNGRDPSESELARSSGVAVSRLRTALRSIQPITSLDNAFEDNEDLNLLSMVEQQVFPRPEDEVSNQSLKQSIERAIIKLNRREAFVVRQRFGIGTYQECTLQEVGDVLGLTRERVRQIEARALEKLRRPLMNENHGVSG